MKKKNVLMMSSALVLGLGSVAVGSALVTQAGERFGMGGLGSHEAVESAMEAGDYNAWKEALGDRPMADQVTQEDFTKMQEAHELREEGKYEEARQIREELGFAGGRGMGGGGRHQ